MRKRTNHWKSVFRWAWVVIGVLVAVGLLMVFIPKIREYRETERQERAIQEDIHKEEETINRLKRRQERFEQDPRFVERVAHDIGMAKPNEVIYKFVDEPEPARPTPTP